MVLARASVTTKQLQQGEFTRAELMSIGLPLGVAAQLVPMANVLAGAGGGVVQPVMPTQSEPPY